MIRLKPSELPALRAVEVDKIRGLWAVVDGQVQVTCLLSENGAKLLAASPGMLKLLALMSARHNAPAKLDIDRVLATAGIELDHD